jgi:MSHA biogenesis protein MshI
MPFLTTRSNPGWLALLPQGDRIVLAHAVCSKDARPEIRLLDVFSTGENKVEALRTLRRSHQLKSYTCTTLMGADEYKIVQMDVPAVPVAERKEALRWKLKAMVDFPVDSACLDLLDIPGNATGGRQASVFAVLAAEQAVRTQAQFFEQAKIPLAAIDIPELAQRNVAVLFEEENRGLVFLHLDAAGGQLSLTFRGELIALRRVEVSAQQLNEGDVGRRTQAMERLLLELQRSLDHFDRQYSYISISKLIVAVSPPVEHLIATLSENLYLAVQEMDLSQVMDFPAVPALRDRQFQAMNLLLIGAALRTADAQESAV